MSRGGLMRAADDVSVGIAELAVVAARDRVIVTYALGSCIGLTLFDPDAGVGGMLHYMLDRPREVTIQHEKPEAMYGTTGIPALFRQAYKLGADKERMIVCAAGGADMMSGGGGLKVGAMNRAILKKIFWKNKIVLAGEDTGGNEARTLRLDLRTGEVVVQSGSSRRVLWKP